MPLPKIITSFVWSIGLGMKYQAGGLPAWVSYALSEIDSNERKHFANRLEMALRQPLSPSDLTDAWRHVGGSLGLEVDGSYSKFMNELLAEVKRQAD
jgi:hypothetical protein